MALQKGEGRYDIIHRHWSVTARADEFDAWQTNPDALGRFGAVAVVCDVWGVTSQLQEFSKLLSRMGYAAIVPDLYYRAGGVPTDADRAQADAITSFISDGRFVADIEDTLAYLRSQSATVDDLRYAAAGFGMGGRSAVLLAARHPLLLRSLVVFSPELRQIQQSDGELRKHDVVEAAAEIQVPVLAFFAGEDDTVDADRVAAFTSALGERGTVVTYPSAKREFLDESSDDYDAAIAADAYGRIIGFLDATVGPAPR
jgi:carboxymethylenebutenolidase